MHECGYEWMHKFGPKIWQEEFPDEAIECFQMT
jgi:hypothetical protein